VTGVRKIESNFKAWFDGQPTDCNRHIPAGQTFPMDTRFVPKGVTASKDRSS
jgi:hypothetical protein